MRIIEEKNKNQKENSVKVIDKPIENDRNLTENRDVHQDKTIEKKEEK